MRLVGDDVDDDDEQQWQRAEEKERALAIILLGRVGEVNCASADR